MNAKQTFSPVDNREHHADARLRRTADELAAPTLHADNLLLDNENDDSPNQLHSRHQGFDLKVLVPRFPDAGNPEEVDGYITLTWNGSPKGELYRYKTPIDVDTTEFQLILPASHSGEPGSHELSYIVSHGGNEDPVLVLPINIDVRAPVITEKPEVPPEVERDGITKEYLDANDNKVVVTAPAYGDKKIGDKVECWFGNSLPNAKKIGEKILTEDSIPSPITFDLTLEHIGLEEGVKSLFMYAADRKGNRSGPSPYTTLNITLTKPPEGLVEASIPLFDNDSGTKLLDLADAQMGVGVGIEAQYTNFIEGLDKLRVTFDGIESPAQTIDTFPFYVIVPYTTVHNGNLGSKTVDVSFQIQRNGLSYPRVPLVKPVAVDLRRPGEGEGEENPNPTLALATVKGAVSTETNILRDIDADELVMVTIPVFDGLKDKDVVTVIWKGEKLTAAQGGSKELDGTETGNLEFELLWAVVDAAGNGKTLPVTYEITHPLNGNAEYSRPQNVDVLIRRGVVPELKFLHLAPVINYLNCASLRPHPQLTQCIEVFVAGGEPQLAGQELEFNYQGYTESGGTTVKPGTNETVKFTPSAQQATDGFVVNFPYAKFLATESAWGAVTYKAVIDGHETDAERHLVRVHMKMGSGAVCPIE